MAMFTLDEAKAMNVLRQVEFYFSDSNLPRDKFLKKAVQDSKDELVSLALVCSFPRMKTHLGMDAATESDGIPEEAVLAVADVLRKSSSLRVSEDGMRVGRSTNPMTPDEVKQLNNRTIAVSPLPYDVKVEDVESFITQCGKVNSVRLARHVSDEKHFCGIALVEFFKDVDAKKVLEGKLIFAGVELKLQTKKDFDLQRERKREDAEKSCFKKNISYGSYPEGLIVVFKLKKKQERNSVQQNDADKVNVSKGGCQREEVLYAVSVENAQEVEDVCKLSGGSNLENEAMTTVDFPNEKEGFADDGQREEVLNTVSVESAQEVEDVCKLSGGINLENEAMTTVDFPNEREGVADDGQREEVLNTVSVESAQDMCKLSGVINLENEAMTTVDFPNEREEVADDGPAHKTEGRGKKCPLVDMKNSGNKNTVAREDLRKVFKKFGVVEYVDYRMGEESGYIRFRNPEAARKACMTRFLVGGGLTVKNYIVTLEVLNGNAEKEYWKLLRGNQEKYNKRGNKGRGGNHRRAGRVNDGKRRKVDSAEGQPRKVQRTEATL